MTEEERQLLLETSMAMTMILDRLQWNDIGSRYFEHIEPYLKAIKTAKLAAQRQYELPSESVNSA